MKATWLVCILVAAHGLGQPAGLPPPEPFFTEARAALSRSQELWHRYAYRERRTELHLNPFGRMGTGGTRVLEVRPSPIEGLGIFAVRPCRADHRNAPVGGGGAVTPPPPHPPPPGARPSIIAKS